MAEVGFAICNTSDNGFALAGYAWSANSGDLIGSINQGKDLRYTIDDLRFKIFDTNAWAFWWLCRQFQQ
jgi:hypothetical protein